MFTLIRRLLEERRHRRNVKACLALVREINVDVQASQLLAARLTETDL